MAPGVVIVLKLIVPFLPISSSDLQDEFRSALGELIDQVYNEATPVLQEMGEGIEQCKSRLREEWSPCKSCVESQCGE